MTQDGNHHKPSRYGRRLEDLSEDERAYYRDFLPLPPSPTTSAAEPLPGAEPASARRPRRKNRWVWAAHGLLIAGALSALACLTVVPVAYADLAPELQRNYIMMWAELAFFFILFAALLYGIFALAAFTDHDDEEDARLMRPTDYAEQLLEKDLERNRGKGGDDFYDSSWITGR